LETFEERLSQRLDSSFRLEEALDGIKGVRIITAPKGQSPVWTYRPILIDEDKFGKTRDQVASELHIAGIQVRKYYTACHKLKCFYPPSAILPVSEMIASQVISLPLYDNMSMDECQKISRSLKEIKNS
jgi:dTDP-4-amino-4,6-dideoxygalactose transaminase